MSLCESPLSNRNHHCLKTADPGASRVSKSQLRKASLREREEAETLPSPGNRRGSDLTTLKRKLETNTTLYRTATFDRSAVNETARTVRLSISSDVPYLRSDFFGQPYYEVLDHSPGGIISDRLTSGAAVLFNHDRSQHLGRNISFENDGHKCSIVAKFSRSAFAEEKWRDVQDGILVDSSVGYEVLDVEELDQEIDGTPVYVVKWQPLEASLVTVPADLTVGVGREHQISHQPTNYMTPPTTTQPTNERTATQERERINAIRYAANRPTFQRFVTEADVQNAIDQGWSKKAFNEFLLERMGEGGPQLFMPETREFGAENTRTIASRIMSHRDVQRFLEGGRKRVSFELRDVRSFRETLTRVSNTIIGNSDVGATITRLPNVQGVAFERLVVADLCAPGSMDTSKVTYPRENSIAFAGTAAPVPEANRKPEQAFDLVPDEAAAKKIAAFTKITDEMFQDSPAAEAYIQNRLAFAVQKSEDNQLLQGDGLNANMRGIRSTPNVQVQQRGADIAPDAIRKGINLVETTTDFIVSGIVMHPTDWMNIQLLKDTQGRYLIGQAVVPDEFGHPRLAPTLWSRPIAISKSIPIGTSLVGAFATAAQVFRRLGMIIEMSNENEDDFIRNLITILAETRVALAVYSGAAFCDVTGL